MSAYCYICVLILLYDIFVSSYWLHVEQVEEERRLAYVGMTRAKEMLYMTWHKSVFGRGRPADREDPGVCVCERERERGSLRSRQAC